MSGETFIALLATAACIAATGALFGLAAGHTPDGRWRPLWPLVLGSGAIGLGALGLLLYVLVSLGRSNAFY